jgi:hypothetical protein
VHAVVEKVEITADRFKLKKKCKKLAIAYVIILALCLVGCAVRHHMKGQWKQGHSGNGMNRPQKGGMRNHGSRHNNQQKPQGPTPSPMGPFPVNNNPTQMPHPTPNLNGPRGQAPGAAPQGPTPVDANNQRSERPHWNGEHRRGGHHERRGRHHGRGEGKDRKEWKHKRDFKPEENKPEENKPEENKPEENKPVVPEPAILPVTPKPVPILQAPTIIPQQAPLLGAPSLDISAGAASSTAMSSGPITAEGKVSPQYLKLEERRGHHFGNRHLKKRFFRHHMKKFFKRWMMRKMFHRMMRHRFAGRMSGHHMKMKRGFMGHKFSGKWRRHHKKGKCFKIALFFILIPLLMFLGFRCHMKKIHKRVQALLAVENRIFREKYGCEWTTNKRVTELSLRRVCMNVQQQIQAAPRVQLATPAPQFTQGYPIPHQGPTPFTHAQEIPAPLFTEESARPPNRYAEPKGYQRVSLDDSSVGYR